jgi:hypothetical protein
MGRNRGYMSAIFYTGIKMDYHHTFLYLNKADCFIQVHNEMPIQKAKEIP